MVAVRASIPPSSLKLEFIRSDSISTHKKIIQVDLNRERRHYYYYSENSGKPILTVADEKIVPDQGAYDNRQVTTYDPSDSIFSEIMHITDQSEQSLFDSRILGVNDLQADSSSRRSCGKKSESVFDPSKLRGESELGIAMFGMFKLL